MDFDPEKNMHENVATKAVVDDRSSPTRSTTEYYNSTPVTQDHGILSRLRRFEAALDVRLGVGKSLPNLWRSVFSVSRHLSLAKTGGVPNPSRPQC